MTFAELRRRGFESGQLVVLSFLLVLGAGIPLLALSPTLNPADLLLGRYRFQETPDLIGLTQPKAIQALVREGLDSTVRFDYSATVPRGEVAAQDPPSGDPVRRGGKVTVTVSRGKAEFVVPKLVGTTRRSVEKLFADTGVALDIAEFPTEDAVAGEVIRQDPLPGEVVRSGDTLALVVSQGAQKRKVPEVRRLPAAGAAFILGNAGFVVDGVTLERDPFLPKGAVVRTDPAVGKNLNKDTVVELVVSDGPPQVKAPTLVGTQETQALESLESIGLVAATTTRLVGPSDPINGEVLTQKPDAGTLMDPGQVVEILVAREGTPG
ncbi:MAG: PASTA domain-containing protein [Candidatus Microthrix sp.]|jgi:beta-lactam-binding protein with PASTA domain|nr:Stk1 family PASTA domain-containing Ser/Thr kinase [Candidatus Microthrix sp.]MBK9559113.1 PASTA domain-containing protein [Candidatus Microthrix sp.]MBP7594923.1 PASTA domain-containing protein [Candidatus Microthrix sp.]MBP9065773.1 PASTA domain-containing protein [Candidatus Microthrix sp.]